MRSILSGISWFSVRSGKGGLCSLPLGFSSFEKYPGLLPKSFLSCNVPLINTTHHNTDLFHHILNTTVKNLLFPVAGIFQPWLQWEEQKGLVWVFMSKMMQRLSFQHLRYLSRRQHCQWQAGSNYLPGLWWRTPTCRRNQPPGKNWKYEIETVRLIAVWYKNNMNIPNTYSGNTGYKCSEDTGVWQIPMESI